MTPPINPHSNDLPGDDLLGDDLPGDDLPGDDLPGDDLPGDAADEWQSAWHDCELSNTESVPSESRPLAATPGRLQDYQCLSQLLQSLPVEPMPPEFASRVIALLPDSASVPRSPSQSAPHKSAPDKSAPDKSASEGGFRRFSMPFWGCLAASLTGLIVFVGRWQPLAPSNQSAQDTQPPVPSASAAKIDSGAAKVELAVRPSLASQLEEIPPEKLAIVRIRVPQRGAISDAESAAMNLTVRAFGEHWITQVPEGPRLPEGTPAAQGPSQVAARAADSGGVLSADPPDPMQLLVVGESEAIVQAIEQLLRNLEQTELEEEIRAVARTELDQFSTELSPSLGQFLDNLEQTWSPAVLPAKQVVIRGMQPSPGENASAAGPREEARDGNSERQPHSRGSMAWVPPASIPLPISSGSLETSDANRPVGRWNQVPASEAKRARLAKEQARTELGGRARPLENPQSLEEIFSAADKAPGIPPESESADGRRPRRVLIQLICDPAG
jgi:hypothetical protein